MFKKVIILLLSLLLIGCASNKENTEIEEDNFQNKVCSAENENCAERGLTSDVKDPEMETITFEESVNYLDETVALFFSFEDCPWCYDAIQVLNQVYKNYDIPTYYVDVKREERTEGNEAYDKVVEKINVDGKMYVPYFVVLKDGNVVGCNIGTTDDHQKEENVLPVINEMQIAKLKMIYNNLYKEAQE